MQVVQNHNFACKRLAPWINHCKFFCMLATSHKTSYDPSPNSVTDLSPSPTLPIHKYPLLPNKNQTTNTTILARPIHNKQKQKSISSSFPFQPQQNTKIGDTNGHANTPPSNARVPPTSHTHSKTPAPLVRTKQNLKTTQTTSKTH